ncbi:hypothetical protein L1987_80643 [Smallanthus sonchifolius]|uniref:Uncharacterized protein n=1 Tax=Smallanthus sonchifolius TaxID=185202 RepID=A0ACB8YNF2_9ASTR|nr:hypothetical protein L1987_80643 [Smallanthus sonchifolius]
MLKMATMEGESRGLGCEMGALPNGTEISMHIRLEHRGKRPAFKSIATVTPDEGTVVPEHGTTVPSICPDQLYGHALKSDGEIEFKVVDLHPSQ